MYNLLDFIFEISSVMVYAMMVKSRVVPLFSLTGLFLSFNFLAVVIPSYFNYRGGVHYDQNNHINLTVYVLMLLQAVIPSLIAVLVWGQESKIRMVLCVRPGYKTVYVFFFLVVLVYTFLYLYTFRGQIPILNIGKSSILEASQNRSALTHGVLNSEVSGLFLYQRYITKDLLFYILFPLFGFKISLNWFQRLIFGSIVLVSLVAHFEKYYFLQFVLTLYLASKTRGHVFTHKDLKLALLCAVSLIVSTYLFFADTFYDAIIYVPMRSFIQAGYLEQQVLELENVGGFLGLNGLQLGLLGKIFSIEYVDLSKLAWISVHTNLFDQGIEATSAGLAVAELYFVFGYSCVIIYPLIIYIHFRFDRLIRDSIIGCAGKMSDFSERLKLSFYIYLISFYHLHLVGAGLGLFSFAYGMTPSFMVVVLVFALMFKARVKNAADFARMR